MPRLEEADVDLRRVLVDARQQEPVEIVLDDAAVLDVALLIHRVVVEPGDLTFELFLHGERIDQTEPFLVRDIDALDTHLALLAERNGVDHRADRRMSAALRTALFERDRARGALRQRRAPA